VSASAVRVASDISLVFVVVVVVGMGLVNVCYTMYN
jgi:hypothetical protein